MDKISPHLRHAAEQMLWELDGTRLTVALAPSLPHHQPTQRRRRIVEQANPTWYQKFCREWPKQRTRPRRRKHPDTCITRQRTIEALVDIAHGRAKTVYAQRLLPHVEKQASLWGNGGGHE